MEKITSRQVMLTASDQLLSRIPAEAVSMLDLHDLTLPHDAGLMSSGGSDRAVQGTGGGCQGISDLASLQPKAFFLSSQDNGPPVCSESKSKLSQKLQVDGVGDRELADAIAKLPNLIDEVSVERRGRWF
jgi:hypothetical protein